MRMRVVALPKLKLGEAETCPFLLVFDRCTEEQADCLRVADLTATTQAQHVLVFSDEVELDEIQLADVDVDNLDLEDLKRAFSTQTGSAQ